jgi:hypothetical protein
MMAPGSSVDRSGRGEKGVMSLDQSVRRGKGSADPFYVNSTRDPTSRNTHTHDAFPSLSFGPRVNPVGAKQACYILGGAKGVIRL